MTVVVVWALDAHVSVEREFKLIFVQLLQICPATHEARWTRKQGATAPEIQCHNSVFLALAAQPRGRLDCQRFLCRVQTLFGKLEAMSGSSDFLILLILPPHLDGGMFEADRHARVRFRAARGSGLASDLNPPRIPSPAEAREPATPMFSIPHPLDARRAYFRPWLSGPDLTASDVRSQRHLAAVNCLLWHGPSAVMLLSQSRSRRAYFKVAVRHASIAPLTREGPAAAFRS